MPNTSSAKKALRVSNRRRVINLLTKVKIKSALKSLRKALAFDLEAVSTALASTYSMLDKAAKKGVIHKNKADRKKSRMAHLVAKTIASKSV